MGQRPLNYGLFSPFWLQPSYWIWISCRWFCRSPLQGVASPPSSQHTPHALQKPPLRQDNHIQHLNLSSSFYKAPSTCSFLPWISFNCGVMIGIMLQIQRVSFSIIVWDKNICLNSVFTPLLSPPPNCHSFHTLLTFSAHTALEGSLCWKPSCPVGTGDI